MATYNSDLTYIRDFKRYKLKELSATHYSKKQTGSFKSFINEFRVARNVVESKTDILLQETTDWITHANAEDVDGFAQKLNASGITHGKIMTSLASKILFLNNPWQILPLDRLAKRALVLQTNRYKDYLPLLTDYVSKNREVILGLLSTVEYHFTFIEKQFQHEIENIQAIRFNRMVDKILWTSGRNRQSKT